MRSSVPVLAIALAAALPMTAQATHRARSHEQSGRSAANQMVSDQDFVSKVESGTQFELQAARLAVDKAQSPAVKRFAQRMVKDHTQASDDLQKTIEADPNKQLPKSASIASNMSSEIQDLQNASGKTFDAKFVDVMVDDHKNDVDLFRSYEKNGSDPKLQSFARRTLPTIEEHLHMAQRLQKTEANT